MTGMATLLRCGWVKNSISFVLAIGVAVFAAIPFAINVKADNVSNTYMVVESGECYVFAHHGITNQRPDGIAMRLTVSSDDEVRLAYWYKNGSLCIFLCSLSPFVYYTSTASGGSPSCAVPTTNSIAYTYNNTTYYRSTRLTFLPQEFHDEVFTCANLYPSETDMPSEETFISYIYGDNAVDPSPPEPEPDEGLGQLKDVSYSTDVIGYQGYGYANRDTISWNRFKSTTGHYLTPSNHKIEIRVVSAQYMAESRSALESLTYRDIAMNLLDYATLYNGSPDPGYITIPWSDVFNALSKTFADIWNIVEITQNQTAYWTREGWVYQIRFYCEPEDSYSEWQTIYPLVSSSGNSMEGFTQTGDPVYNTEFNDYYDLVNSMNNTSMVNNNYNNTMTINNNEYVTNPDNHITNETNNDVTNNFIENFRQYHDKEDDYIGNFEDMLQDIDPTSEVIDDANFLSAGNWVKTQYVRMVQGTPIEKLVQFSLTLGLGILIIGKAK